MVSLRPPSPMYPTHHPTHHPKKPTYKKGLCNRPITFYWQLVGMFSLKFSDKSLRQYSCYTYSCYSITYEPWHDKTNKMSVCPTKTQISLDVCPVWSAAWASAQSDQSSLCAQWVAKDPSFLHADSHVHLAVYFVQDPSFLHADSEDWSGWADAQADLSLRWAHTYLVGFVMSRLI